MARKAKDTHTPHLRLRVEPSLLARLEKSAEKNGRTLTGEIVDRLDASFKRDDMQAYVDATALRTAQRLMLASENTQMMAELREIAKQLRESDAWQAVLRAKKGNEQ